MNENESGSLDAKKCVVCFQSTDSSTENIISCQTCGVCVHPSCYGCSSKSFANWKCRYCKYCEKNEIDGRANEYCVRCGICDQNTFGALKKCDPDDGTFAHLVCALLTPFVYVFKEFNNCPIYNIEQCEQLRPVLSKIKCSLCGKGNATIKCRVKECGCNYHPLCFMEKYSHCLFKTNGVITKANSNQKVSATMYCVYCPQHVHLHQEYAWTDVTRKESGDGRAAVLTNDQSEGGDDKAADQDDEAESKTEDVQLDDCSAMEVTGSNGVDFADDQTLISQMSVDDIGTLSTHGQFLHDDGLMNMNIIGCGRRSSSSPFGQSNFGLPKLSGCLSPRGTCGSDHGIEGESISNHSDPNCVQTLPFSQ